MDTIAIPSPTAFLSAPPPQAAPLTRMSSMEGAKPKQPARTKSESAKAKDGVTKPKQSKSRNGCVTCKAKRLKCDETKPTCNNCLRRGVVCGGYKKDFKWRAFGEDTFAEKPSVPTKPKRNSQGSKNSAPLHASSPSDGCASTTTPTAAPISPSIMSSLQSPVGDLNNAATHSPFAYNHFTVDSGTFSNHPDNPPPAFTEGVEIQPRPGNPTLAFQYPMTTISDHPWLGQMLPSRSQPSTPVQHRPSQPNIHSSTLAFPPFNEETTNLQQEEVEEIPRNELYKHDAAYHGGSAYLSEQDFVFNQPKLGAESHEMLLMNFDRFTCGILSVRNGPNENPWRTMVWPMASRSPVLFHAIAALSAFHKSTTRPEMKACGLEHMNKSIASLKTGVEQTPVLVGLATTLVLGFAECWDSHIRAGITHLRPGKYLVIKALTAVRQRRIVDRGAVALIKFLCNTWLYMDVLARLAGTDTEDRTEIDAELWSSIDQQGTSEEIDPLMGCAATLFPIIGRVGNLVRRVRSSPTNGLSVVSYGNELKQELEQWTPPDFLNKPEDPACDVSHSVQTAEAYRWATLLYLHQAVPEIPCWDSGQLAKKVLMYLATVPLHSRTIIVHIYPLLAAGCEASDKEDRDWVSDRWRSMSQRMQIGNVDKCFEVTREVWRRRDRAQEERANLRRSSLTLPMGSSAFPPGMSGVARTDRYDTASPSAWGSVIHEHGYLKQENVGTRPSVPFPEQMSMSPLETHYQSPPFPEPINLSRFESRQQSMPIPESTGMSPVEGHQLPFPYTERPHEPGIPMRRSSTRSSMSHSRRESTERKDDFDIEQGVKGSQHWVGVMRDWDWEILLG